MMESKNIVLELTKSINQLKQINNLPLLLLNDKKKEQEEKEFPLIKKIISCFHQILMDNFTKKAQKSPQSKDNQCNYWIFISKHFNTPIVRFCKEYDKNDLNSSFMGDNLTQKGKNWIFLSILENTFSESIHEIYNHGWDQNNSILSKNKSEIFNILNELRQLHFNNINNVDYIKYLEYLENNKKKNNNIHPIVLASPIFGEEISNQSFSDISDISIINKNKTNPIDTISIIDPINVNPFIKETDEFTIKKNSDLLPKIINNF